jgi:hypothetical protein
LTIKGNCGSIDTYRGDEAKVYIVVEDGTGYFVLLKFTSISNKFDEIVDRISKEDYTTKEDAKEYFRKIYKIELP